MVVQIYRRQRAPRRIGAFMKLPLALLALSIVGGAHAQTAKTTPPAKPEAHRLEAETVLLTQPVQSNPQLEIWADKTPALLADREQLQKAVPSMPLVAEFFTTHFDIDGATYYVSAVNFNCASSSALPNALDCPARVAKMEGGKLHVIADLPRLLILAVRGEAGFDATTNANQKFKTVVELDSAKHALVFSGVADGQSLAFDTTVPVK